MIYWYYVYTYTGKLEPYRLSFQSDVFRGTFSELVLHIHEQNRTDEHYTDFRLVNWNKITQGAFERLDEVLG